MTLRWSDEFQRAMAEPRIPLPLSEQCYATRRLHRRTEKVECLINENGAVIGYVKTCNVLNKYQRVHLGYAMGCVKEDDTVLLPLGYASEQDVRRRWLPMSIQPSSLQNRFYQGSEPSLVHEEEDDLSGPRFYADL